MVIDQRTKLLKTVERAWNAFNASFDDLPDRRLVEPGVIGDWTAKDILAHVTTWEEESLQHLPEIVAGVTPTRYSVAYGGVNVFNALKSEEKRLLSLAEVKSQLETTHDRLVDYLMGVPEPQLDSKTRFRRRLYLDTYGHYSIHTKGILQWRERLGV